MSRGFPSMTALLGLLAVAGYQNRDKIAEMLQGAGGGSGAGGAGTGGFGQGASGQSGQASSGGMGGGLGGLLGGLAGGGLGGLLGGSSQGSNPGGFLNGGLNELVERFRENGHGDAADSWIGPGQNREVAPQDLEQAIGPDVLATLTEKTGLSREDLLQRLSRELPRAVDQYTPDGRLPQS